MSATPSNPLWLAPMADVTLWPVRKMFFGLGVGLAHTEMVSARAIIEKSHVAYDMLYRHPKEGALVLQLFSGDIDVLLNGAKEALKVNRFNALGMNMACPSRKVMASGGGAALIYRPNIASRMVKELKTLGLPVWVKTRIPSHDPSDAFNWCELLLASGADNVAIHARTPSQGYNGKSDRKIVREIAESFPGMISATGDVFSVSDVLEYIEMGCVGVMIARGALKDPFIVTEALKALGYSVGMDDSLGFRIDVFRSFFADLGDIRDNIAMPLLRRFLSCIFKNVPRASYIRSSLANAGSIVRARELYDAFVDELKLTFQF